MKSFLIVFIFLLLSVNALNIRTHLSQVDIPLKTTDTFLPTKTVKTLSSGAKPLSTLEPSIKPVKVSAPAPEQNANNILCVPKTCELNEVSAGPCPCLKGAQYEANHFEPTYKPQTPCILPGGLGCTPQPVEHLPVQYKDTSDSFEPAYVQNDVQLTQTLSG